MVCGGKVSPSGKVLDGTVPGAGVKVPPGETVPDMVGCTTMLTMGVPVPLESSKKVDSSLIRYNPMFNDSNVVELDDGNVGEITSGPNSSRDAGKRSSLVLV